MKTYLYDSQILPDGFKFPHEYVDIILKINPDEFYPWKFMATDLAISIYYFGALLLQFPEKPLIPFAIINDESGVYNDGWVVLACFDGLDFSGNPKVLIQDYSNPKASPWENKSYENFSDWIKSAKKDSLDYKSYFT